MDNTIYVSTVFLSSYVVFFNAFRFLSPPDGAPDGGALMPLLWNASTVASFFLCVAAANGQLMRPAGLDASFWLIVLAAFHRHSVLGLLLLAFAPCHPFGTFQ